MSSASHCLAAALLAGFALVSQAGAEDVPQPPGYRMSDYRAPVPASLEGGTVVSIEQVRAVAGTGEVVLIDVLPRPPRPTALPEDTLWLPRPRFNIPDSTWLPNTGFGALSEASERYFLGNIERLTEGDRNRKILFYCLADCWMSWNAAKRAIANGYGNVLWFPEGTDAWRNAGLPTERSEPAPGWDLEQAMEAARPQ